MPGCVLHVTGEAFDVDAFLVDSDLRPYRVHRRGETRRRSGTFSNSGLSLDISIADGELVKEVNDAIQFLSTHERELRRLHDFVGVTDLRLDFGYYHREVAGQSDYLPSELLLRAGRLGIGIELSLYAAQLPESIAS